MVHRDTHATSWVLAALSAPLRRARLLGVSNVVLLERLRETCAKASLDAGVRIRRLLSR
jgi:hypothetical protein